MVAGIGCASRLPGYVKGFRLHTVHGRALPAATGVKVANPDLLVLAVTGDGDGVAIGGNHFLHTMARNPDITHILLDNSVYGMTRGQASPTSPPGLETRSTPYGTLDRGMDPVVVALSAGATFVARAFAGDIRGLRELTEAAMRHRGVSFLHVLSPCVTFRDTTRELRAAVKPLPEDHGVSDRPAAIAAAMENPHALGVYYVEEAPTLEDKLRLIREDAVSTRGAGDLRVLLRTFQ
jgi:2-oxoglutarate ferredoxin oxidoreductase subunit beta